LGDPVAVPIGFASHTLSLLAAIPLIIAVWISRPSYLKGAENLGWQPSDYFWKYKDKNKCNQL